MQIRRVFKTKQPEAPTLENSTMVSRKQRYHLSLQYPSLSGIRYPKKNTGATEKQMGSHSQSTSTVLHHNEDPGCFIHNKFLAQVDIVLFHFLFVQGYGRQNCKTSIPWKG